MSYELRNHTADVAVEATGPTFDAVVAAVADGLAAAMCESIPEGGERFDVEVTAESREALLFDYLDELIYQRDVRAVLPVDNAATVEEHDGAFHLDGSARGVPLSDVSAREIKAVTYSEMEIEKTDQELASEAIAESSERRSDGGWRAYVVFDV